MTRKNREEQVGGVKSELELRRKLIPRAIEDDYRERQNQWIESPVLKDPGAIAHALCYAVTGLRRLRWAEAEADALGDSTEARFLLGKAYLNASIYPKAVEILHEAVAREPSNAAHRAFHAKSLLRSGKRDEAEAEAKEALKLDPSSKEARSVLDELEFGLPSADV